MEVHIQYIDTKGSFYGGKCMKNALETYQLELKVRGPVYIGSGREIQKKEYVFLDKTTVGVVDIEKLYRLSERKHIVSDLEHFMLEDAREDEALGKSK